MLVLRGFLHAFAPVALVASTCAIADAKVVAGKAVSVAGDVLVRNEGAGPSGARKLKAGDEILKSDVINTASNGSAKLLLVDKSVLDLGGSTLFKVDEFRMRSGSDRDVEMTMGYGRIRAAVNTPVGAQGKYRIRTKSATMGVRGTEFIVAADLGELAPPPGPETSSSSVAGGASSAKGAPTTVKTQITVVEGKVEVSDTTAPKKAPIAVAKGERITTIAEVVGDKAVRKPAEAPAARVVSVSPEQLRAATEAATVKDQTFKQAVVIDPSGQGGPASGLATLSEIGSAFSTTPEFVPNPGQIGTPGTFGSGFSPMQPVLPPGSGINLQVVFKR